MMEGVGRNDNLTHGDPIPGWYGGHPIPDLPSPYRENREHKGDNQGVSAEGFTSQSPVLWKAPTSHQLAHPSQSPALNGGGGD